MYYAVTCIFIFIHAAIADVLLFQNYLFQKRSEPFSLSEGRRAEVYTVRLDGPPSNEVAITVNPADDFLRFILFSSCIGTEAVQCRVIIHVYIWPKRESSYLVIHMCSRELPNGQENVFPFNAHSPHYVHVCCYNYGKIHNITHYKVKCSSVFTLI